MQPNLEHIGPGHYHEWLGKCHFVKPQESLCPKINCFTLTTVKYAGTFWISQFVEHWRMKQWS